jgi:hypothetical protein
MTFGTALAAELGRFLLSGNLTSAGRGDRTQQRFDFSQVYAD